MKSVLRPLPGPRSMPGSMREGRVTSGFATDGGRPIFIGALWGSWRPGEPAKGRLRGRSCRRGRFMRGGHTMPSAAPYHPYGSLALPGELGPYREKRRDDTIFRLTRIALIGGQDWRCPPLWRSLRKDPGSIGLCDPSGSVPGLPDSSVRHGLVVAVFRA